MFRFFENDPFTWDSNSMQDTALYILMNLALTPAIRPHLRNPNVARKLGAIAKFSSSCATFQSLSVDEEKQQNLQCLKARMTLGYLFGTEGHVGYQNMHESSHVQVENTHDILLIKGYEAPLLVELLANTLHRRGKIGAGGYNLSTFNVKKALYATRCLLSHPLNVKTFYITCGMKLNVLLLKALALHSIQDDSQVDIEAAEDACFSLYLLSNHGFKGSFLPHPEDRLLFQKILNCYSRKQTCTAAGKHAAMQLLLRHPYLIYGGSLEDDEPKQILHSDLEFDAALFHAVKEVKTFEITAGAQPLDDIFGRPLIRKEIAAAGKKKPLPWHTVDAPQTFHNALEAVREFSFGSEMHTNLDGFIDDIEIANNIANCANGSRNEAYGYEWRWQDGGIDEQDVREKLKQFRNGKIDAFRGLLKNVGSRDRPLEPIRIFGINCGCNSIIVD